MQDGSRFRADLVQRRAPGSARRIRREDASADEPELTRAGCARDDGIFVPPISTPTSTPGP